MQPSLFPYIVCFQSTYTVDQFIFYDDVTLGSTSRPLAICNGIIALQIAIKALELKGEIFATPFSYIASTSSIVLESYKPLFETFTLII